MGLSFTPMLGFANRFSKQKAINMNFDFSESVRQFQQVLALALADKETPESGPGEKKGAIPAWVGNYQQILAEVGYLDLVFKLPGQTSGDSLHTLASQEILAAFSQSLYLTVEMSARMFGSVVQFWGTPEQQAQLLPALKSGKIMGAVALSEDAMNVTNDPWKTEGIVHNNTIRVSAKKTYVVNAPWADWIGVAGRMQDQTVIFLVEKNTQGLKIDEPLETMGYEAAAIAGIQLESCSVPADRIILLPDSAAALASLQRWENQILMGAGLGMMKAAFTSAKDFANTHQTGGKPIIAYQEVAFKLAEMLTLYQTSQLLAYRAAWTADNQPHEKAGLTLCAKVFCAESAEKVASMALQVLSGQGYLRGSRAADAYACAKYTQIAGTSMEIARVMIGDESLGYR